MSSPRQTKQQSSNSALPSATKPPMHLWNEDNTSDNTSEKNAFVKRLAGLPPPTWLTEHKFDGRSLPENIMQWVVEKQYENDDLTWHFGNPATKTNPLMSNIYAELFFTINPGCDDTRDRTLVDAYDLKVNSFDGKKASECYKECSKREEIEKISLQASDDAKQRFDSIGKGSKLKFILPKQQSSQKYPKTYAYFYRAEMMALLKIVEKWVQHQKEKATNNSKIQNPATIEAGKDRLRSSRSRSPGTHPKFSSRKYRDRRDR